MSQWKEQLNCKGCNEPLNIPNYQNSFNCENCGKQYQISLDNPQYAVAESTTTQYYKLNEDDTICMRYFENEPLDTLEEAYQDTDVLNLQECNPHKLLGVVKKYHDALKMCVRRLLELYPGNLSPSEIEQVKNDNQRNKPSLNIRNLFDYLKKAYPSKDIGINNVENTHKDMIKKIWWVRNKSEHILHTQWPINAKIFQNRRQNPNSPDPASDRLNYNFIKRVNHTVIDIYNFILTLRPTPPNQWQIDTVEYFRINKNP